MTCINDIWADGSNATLTPPTATDISNGFVCGPADPGIFNWLFNKLTSCLITIENSLNTTIANLASVQSQVSQNISDIASNTSAISSNTSTIEINTSDIAALQAAAIYNDGMTQGTIV